MKSSDDRAARGSGGASVGDAEKAAGKTAAEIRAADVTAVSAAPECRPSYAEVIPSADGGLFYGALGAAAEGTAPNSFTQQRRRLCCSRGKFCHWVCTFSFSSSMGPVSA